jgi:tetratricopeptide (TPR) repeat protein
VDQSPNYDYGYYMLGLCFTKMNKPKEAEKNFRKAIELNGERFEYHDGLAKAYFYGKEYAKSVATLKSAEPLASNDQAKYSMYSLRGFAYAALEKWGDAVEDLERARAIKRDGPVTVQLGKAYYSLGHSEEAVPVFRAALKINPNDAGTKQLLAESLINLGAEAKSDSQKASYYGEALQVAEGYQQAKPDSYEAHNLVGRAALGAKDYAKAEQAFRRVLAQKSDYCYAMVNLGKTKIARKQWAEAESILKDAAACAPRMPVIYESLGFVVEKQKRLPEAVGYYEQAYELKPSQGIRTAIDRCNQNIAIAQENQEMDAAERAAEEAARKAREEYEAELAKQREWEERRRRDE